MKKNINLKIVIIFFFIGIVLILGLGIGYILMLNQIETIGVAQGNEQLINNINNQLNQTKIMIIISSICYTIISILIGFFVLKALVSPMKKLIKSAEKVASGENVDIEANIQNTRRSRRFRKCI